MLKPLSPAGAHPAFEIMYILDGAQRTVTELAEKIIKAGEMMTIPLAWNTPTIAEAMNQ